MSTFLVSISTLQRDNIAKHSGSYMADTQYFKTETWTETSTGPNKCPNRDLDCVCFNGQDRDCPRPSLVSSPVACTWPVPVPVASLS